MNTNNIPIHKYHKMIVSIKKNINFNFISISIDYEGKTYPNS